MLGSGTELYEGMPGWAGRPSREREVIPCSWDGASYRRRSCPRVPVNCLLTTKRLIGIHSPIHLLLTGLAGELINRIKIGDLPYAQLAVVVLVPCKLL